METPPEATSLQEKKDQNNDNEGSQARGTQAGSESDVSAPLQPPPPPLPPASSSHHAVRRFRKAARSVVLMCRLCRCFMSCSNYSYGVDFRILESVSSPPSGGSDQNLVFDLNHFKMKEDRIPVHLEVVLRKGPGCRSDADVLLLRNMLTAVEVFRHYSPALQALLARVVRYQRLERRRVVIKKGHAGQSFYLVFSGLLAVTEDNDGSSAFVDKEPILIKKGMSFGDVALVKGLRRNATVVCMEDTELMVIDKEDFFHNKMDVELKREFEYRFSFFRSLQLVSSWSSADIERMSDHSQAEEYLYGRVVVKDTNEMGNIIFIGKGQCDVLRVVDLTSCSTYQRLLKQHLDSASETRAKRNGLPVEKSDRQTMRQGSSSNYKVLQNMPTPSRALLADLPKSACFLIDSLQQGGTFGLNQYLVPHRQRDCRRFTLISRSVEIFRIEKTCFDDLVDDSTLKKLEDLEKTYPSDEELCRVFLEHSRWNEFKNAAVQDVLYQQVALKAAKHQASPAGPSPPWRN